MQFGGYQIVGNIFIATLYAQHVDAESLAQVGIAYAQTGKLDVGITTISVSPRS